MIGGIDGVGGAARSAFGSGNVGARAQALIDASRQAGVQNMRTLASDLTELAQKDPAAAADLLAEIKPRLSVVDQQRLGEELATQVDAKLTRPAAAGADAAAKRELALDLTQIGLSIAGIFDPTPISDGIDGAISLFRGDFLGAGISVVSMIPYLGDAAKLGKLGKFAETVAKAVDVAKVDAKFAEAVAPALGKIRDAIRALPLDSLPKPAREALESMANKIDELHAGKAAYESVVRGEKVLLDGIELRSVNYVKRDRTAYDQLRREFDSSKRSDFLKDLAGDPAKVRALREAGLDDAAIARIGQGKVPAGYQVHHKLPLDDGGTNAIDNLVLIKNDPFHIGITNAQGRLVGDLAEGQARRVDWPVVPGFVYPPK